MISYDSVPDYMDEMVHEFNLNSHMVNVCSGRNGSQKMEKEFAKLAIAELFLITSESSISSLDFLLREYQKSGLNYKAVGGSGDNCNVSSTQLVRKLLANVDKQSNNARTVTNLEHAIDNRLPLFGHRHDLNFLIINKKDKRFSWCSLLDLQGVVPNGNNLPFQVDFTNLSYIKDLDELEAARYLRIQYHTSICKRVQQNGIPTKAYT